MRKTIVYIVKCSCGHFIEVAQKNRLSAEDLKALEESLCHHCREKGENNVVS